MPPRGRKPLPSGWKAFTGNPGKRPLNAAEPQPEMLRGYVRCPPYVTGHARREWHRVCGQLAEIGVLSKLDLAMLEAYCTSYGNWLDAELTVQEEGQFYRSTKKVGTDERGKDVFTEVLVKHPCVAIAQAERQQLRMYAAELGLSPSTRTHLKAQPEDPGERDPAAERAGDYFGSA